MRKAKSAVMYGMETLRVSPDELFKLIESSQGYDGDDYNRWLAGRIIEVAEKDGVQFSQLLAKKFVIVNEILEEVSDVQSIKEEFLDIFKSTLNDTLYSVDFEGLGESVEVDWFTGLDLDSENSFFVREKLPLDIQKNIIENEKFSFIINLSTEGSSKKSELYQDAKAQGILLNTEGAMMLYRLCNLVSAFDLSNMKCGILLPVKFLYDEDNSAIVDYFLSFFKLEEGYCMKSIEVSKNAFNSGDLAYITVVPRCDEEQDGVLLTTITLDDTELSGFSELDEKRYSKSETPMLNKIADNSPKLVDDVLCNGDPGICKGLNSALGYLNVNGDISLSSLPEGGDKKVIAITKDNIKDIIVFFGVTVARELDWGYSTDIPCLMDGKVGYEELLYNCLPLFLFDYRSGFRNIDMPDGSLFENRLDVLKSDIVNELLDVGLPYFSFEAKELHNTCVDFLKYVEDEEVLAGKTFNELRELSYNDDFNKMYESRLLTLKEYVNKLSKNYL